jgi:hypothetical protein
MAKTRSDKSPYPSRYSPEKWVSAAQWIAEVMCEKKAGNDNGGELPYQFWELPEWKRYFQYQVVLANNMIKEFGEKAIIAALTDLRSWKTYSLRGGYFKKLVKEHKERIDAAANNVKEVEYDFSEKKTFDSNNDKQSSLSKLRELE